MGLKFIFLFLDSSGKVRNANLGRIVILFYYFLILFYLTLQYCIGFAIYQNESDTGIHNIFINNKFSKVAGNRLT